MLACLCTPVVQGNNEVRTVTHGAIALVLCMRLWLTMYR